MQESSLIGRGAGRRERENLAVFIVWHKSALLCAVTGWRDDGRGPKSQYWVPSVTGPSLTSLHSHMTADDNLHQQKSPLCCDPGLPAALATRARTREEIYFKGTLGFLATILSPGVGSWSWYFCVTRPFAWVPESKLTTTVLIYFSSVYMP